MVKHIIIKLPPNMPKYCPDDGTKLRKQPVLSRDDKGKRVIFEGGLHCSTCNRRFFSDEEDPFKDRNPNNMRI